MSSLLFKFKPFEATTIFQFQDPDTGRVHTAKDKKELVQLIVSYRAQNQLEPIENLDIVLEHYLCTLPQNCGKCCFRDRLKRGFFTYLKGGIMLVKNYWYKETVTPEEAEERAKQCAACPLNVFPDKGPFVRFADEIAMSSVGTKRTTQYERLGNCAACTCVLNAKVWFKGKLSLTPEEKILMEGVRCWQLKLESES